MKNGNFLRDSSSFFIAPLILKTQTINLQLKTKPSILSGRFKVSFQKMITIEADKNI